MNDDLTLVVRGQRLSGWDTIRVTAGMERCPNDFDLTLTERYPGAADFAVFPGDPCEVYLGPDPVIKGYIDRFDPAIGPEEHSIQVSGRGRCADLVDCAAEWPGGQISSASALSIAQKLCEPYGLSASCATDPGQPIPQLILNSGETAFEVIERVCRFAALLAYEGPDGNLVLSRVGTDKTASGFKEGVNVERAAIAYTADQQFSEYLVVRMAMDVLQDLGDGGNVVAKVVNPNVKRHRRRIIVAEGGDAGSQVAEQRAVWEANRRFGRSAQLRLSTDGWRDSAGLLYWPNKLVDLELPTLKATGKTWLISEVTFRRDMRGTGADLVIMHPDAFRPQPILLQQGPADIPIGGGQ
ncbi:phage baseplate assembly protein [Pseudoduganella sp. RAF53_2]|uniref:phage baseplate assembly protein n=1 Tax=unclassified Pseudoduganella TaxID=2637179 RepID=UPI003F9BC7B5